MTRDDDTPEPATGVFLVAATALICIAYARGCHDGADVRRCAAGPSTDDGRMVEMMEACRAVGGAWFWDIGTGSDLHVMGTCIGGAI